MNLVFTCGGTGGHINPAIAVAKMFRERYPDCNILFIGGDGMEQQLVPREGFKIETLKVAGFQRKLTPKALWHNGVTALQLAGSVRKARNILREFKADAVIGTGGYASFPALREGARLGIPTLVHESNAVPGLATRLVADKVDRIMVAFEDCRKNYKNPEKVVVTGMPCREEFLYQDRTAAREKYTPDGKPLVVSCWGSLGAREMNKKIAAFMQLAAENGEIRHVHATGSYGWRWMPDYIKEHGVDLSAQNNVQMVEYLYDMPVAMAAADLIISRGGAATVGEIAVSATPAIIVPSPNVTDNHQEKNANVLAARGGAVVIREEDCTGEKLYETAVSLLRDKEKLASMRRALTDLAVVDSTERIVAAVMDLIKAQ